MKEYLKMADVFVRTSVEALERHINDGHMSKDAAKYTAHAINSHDELVAEVERLRELLAVGDAMKKAEAVLSGIKAREEL